MTIQKFEDLLCWQKARILANFIFDITDATAFRDIDLKRQIRRASISPLSNIAEGFDRGTRNELIDAFFIAKGEVGEVRSQLYISFDRRYIDEPMLRKGLGLTDECSRLIQSFVFRVKSNQVQGTQFKKVPVEDETKKFFREFQPEAFKKFYPNG